MNIVVTGSLGHIGKPLTERLVQQGHQVTVVSSNPERTKEVEKLGAHAAIGSLEDADFLVGAFANADSVFCMIPPNYRKPDVHEYYQQLGHNYAQAIRQGGIKRVVHLSSFGADLDQGTGPILGSHLVEGILNKVPTIELTHLRPAYFYYNLYQVSDMITESGKIFANYGSDPFPLVAPRDIAAAAAEELTKTSSEAVRYVASSEHSGAEIAGTLGNAIGMPDLSWIVISDEETQKAMESRGVPEKNAALFTDMYRSIENGRLANDYYQNKPATLGQVKLTDFAQEFAAAYKHQ